MTACEDIVLLYGFLSRLSSTRIMTYSGEVLLEYLDRIFVRVQVQAAKVSPDCVFKLRPPGFSLLLCGNTVHHLYKTENRKTNIHSSHKTWNLHKALANRDILLHNCEDHLHSLSAVHSYDYHIHIRWITVV